MSKKKTHAATPCTPASPPVKSPVKSPKVVALSVEKKKSTGTKELAVMARSLDAIHEGMVSFMETVARGDEKNGQVADRLAELAEAIRANPEGIDPEVRDILKDIDSRVFEERYYTEKGKAGAMRMTDDTKFRHLRAFTAEAAKVSAAKFKMSAGDYTPNSIVVEKMRRSLAIFQKALNEHLGPIAGGDAVRACIGDIVAVWE